MMAIKCYLLDDSWTAREAMSKVEMSFPCWTTRKVHFGSIEFLIRCRDIDLPGIERILAHVI